MNRLEDPSEATRNLALYFLNQRLWGDAVRLYQQDCGVTATEAEVAVKQLAECYGLSSPTDSIWYRCVMAAGLLTCGASFLAWLNFVAGN